MGRWKRCEGWEVERVWGGEVGDMRGWKGWRHEGVGTEG